MRKLNAILNNMELEEQRKQDNSAWRKHMQIVIGNPIRVYEGMEVPEVLLSGDHKKINEYRYNESLKRTEERRPDLLKK